MRKVITAVSAISLTLQANDLLSKEAETVQQQAIPQMYATQGGGVYVSKTVALTDDADNSGSPTFGDTLTYTIQVENNDQFNASGLFMTDVLDNNVTLDNGSISTTQGVVISGTTPGDDTVQINLSDVNSGAVVEISFAATINPLPDNGFGVISNQALVDSSNFGLLLSDDPNEPGLRDPTVIRARGNVVPVPLLDKPTGLLGLISAFLLGLFAHLRRKPPQT